MQREGRGIGTKGLADAEDWVQQQLAAAGVEPGADVEAGGPAPGAGANGAWRQPFEVTTEIKRGAKTALTIDGKPIAADAFAPLPFSSQQAGQRGDRVGRLGHRRRRHQARRLQG